MDGIIVTPLKQIDNPKGDIFHAMKKSDEGFQGFGEAYFSMVHKDDIKGWKKHTQMVLNLVVPIGSIEFVVYNENNKKFQSIILSQSNYCRLTVNARMWMAFRGLENFNMLLNLASMEHSPTESISMNLNELKYEW